MFTNPNLLSYLETSSSVSLNSIVLAEWNMNSADNLEALGNYRYRPSVPSASESNFGQIQDDWAVETEASSVKYYYGNTDSNILVNVGLDALTNEPQIFSTKNKTEELLYSLPDTLNRFRPRSGINKIRFFGNNYMNYPNSQVSAQPRFYMASKDDQFKYWNSYRVTDNAGVPLLTGIANTPTDDGDYWIDDTAPFVVYSEPVPANKIVVKMQTGVGDVNLAPNGTTYKKSNNQTFADPFYEDPNNVGNLEHQKTPSVWKIQYLDAKTQKWITAKYFDLNERRQGGTGKRIIGSDGYVELGYGITNLPSGGIKLIGKYVSNKALPTKAAKKDAYLVPSSTNVTSGTIYYWTGTTTPLGDGAPTGYSSFAPEYGWLLAEEGLELNSSIIKSLTEPDFFGNISLEGSDIYDATYREFAFVQGLRIVVDRMSQASATFDLIEMSPRLAVDLSDMTKSFSVEKIASDMGETGIPVGKLSASNGSLSLFDYAQAFNESNVLGISGTKIVGSIISNANTRNLQIKFYEEIVDDREYPDLTYHFVPIKTMYTENVPKINKTDRTVSLELRDLFFYFETTKSPLLLLRNISLSSAVSILLDNIGFSNYKFYKNEDESEDKIPYFFVAPDKTVAQVLEDLAQSTQSAMFFDEYNNFVVMSKNYIMPTEAERATSLTLYGTQDFAPSNLAGSTGAVENFYDPYNAVSKKLANIITLDSEDNIVYNGGKITYTNRYIQKSYATIKEASMLNKSQTYKYKPVLLWEVSGTESVRPTNDEVSNQSSYSLSAVALDSSLTSQLPYVDKDGVIHNNIMDFGDSIYWLTRYAGYFHSNNEIIKYDAVEYSVSGFGDVWIESVSDYQKYFGKLPFNGKMFPTGRVRIYAEPYFNNDGTINVLKSYQDTTGTTYTGAETTSSGNLELTDRGAVAKHGRIQFGTGTLNASGKVFPSEHTVLDETNHWLQAENSTTFSMESQHMFSGDHQYKQSVYAIYQVSGNTLDSKTLTVPDAGNLKGLKKGMLFFPSTDTTYGNTKIPTGTTITKIDVKNKKITISKAITGNIVNATVYAVTKFTDPLVQNAVAGPTLIAKPTLEGTSRDFFDTSTYTESSDANTVDKSKANGSLKSSALSITGPFDPVIYTAEISQYVYDSGTKIATFYTTENHSFKKGNIVTVEDVSISAINPNGVFTISEVTSNTFSVTKELYGPSVGPVASQDGGFAIASNSDKNKLVSYVYKDYSTECPRAHTFGTRMRIVGRPATDAKENEPQQFPIGADYYASITTEESGTFRIDGTGGGIAISVSSPEDTCKNVGYYFEIDALTSSSIIDSSSKNKDVSTIPNVFFYKVMSNSVTGDAIPDVLWYSSATILVDDGLFIGQQKSISTKTPTVYDLSIETEELPIQNGKYRRKFYLYLNGQLVQTVQDDDAIKITNENKKIALFVRGSGKALFEHVYVIGDSPKHQNQPATSPLNKKSAFIDSKLDNDNYRKYLVNPAILQTFLSNLGPQQLPNYTLMFEEFGAIMRECAYFNVRYEKAYPALYSQISPTLNDSQGYVVSNFRANPYGAEFLILNATDFALNLDESSGNYLRIQGVTFTQQSAHDLTVDQYFSKNSDLDGFKDYTNLNNQYKNLQNSIITNGRHDFTINGAYIQNEDTANKIMTWMVEKIMRPKKALGLKVFANPMVQLGDIVKVNYSMDGIEEISPDSRFVVYHITYSRDADGPSMTLYLNEVV